MRAYTGPVPAGIVDHCLELLAPLGAVRALRMFGGHGLYVDELFVAIVAFDRLYLKVDDQTRPRFEAAGCEPFVYEKPPKPASGEQRPSAGSGRGSAVTMSYWTVPAEAMESPALMQPWARQAIAAALRARAAKASAAPRKAAARPAKGVASRRRRQT